MPLTAPPPQDDPEQRHDQLAARVAVLEQRMPADFADMVEADDAIGTALEHRLGVAWRAYASERFAENEARMVLLETKLDANSAATERVELSTAGIVDMMLSWTGAMKTIDGIGKFLRPITWIVGFCTAVAGAIAALRHTDWRN